MLTGVGFCPKCSQPLAAGTPFCRMCKSSTGQRDAKVEGDHLFSGPMSTLAAHRVELGIVAVAVVVIVVLMLGLSGLL